MARRKRKLNKPVVILLTGIGLLVIVLVVTTLWGMGFVDRIFPKDPARLAREAERLLQQKKYREAIRKFDKAVDAARADRPAYLLKAGRARMEYFYNDPSLGQAQRRGLFFKAHAIFKDAVRLKPDMLEAHRELAELERILAASRGAWDSYIQTLDDILRLAPDDHEAMFDRAVAKGRAAEANPDYFEPAVADFKAAIKLVGKAKADPKDAKAVKALAAARERYWVALALFYSRHNRKVEAEKAFKDGMAANPGSAALRITCAEFFQMLNRYPEALGLLREAIKAEPNKAAGYLALAAYHRRQAWRLRRRAGEEKDKARREALLEKVRAEQGKVIEALTKAAEVEPGNCESFLQLAAIRRLQGKLAEAEAALLRGLAAQKESAGQDVSTGGEVRRLSRHRAALLALNHQLCDVLFDRIRAGAKKDDVLPRIQAALEQMRSTMPESPYVAKIEGRLALLEGQRVKAERLLRKAYEGFGARFDLVTAQLLINLYSQLNQLGEAENILNRYLRRYPDNPRALLALARLNMEYREYGKALRIVTTALKKSPEDEQVQRLKVLLEVLTGEADRLSEDIKALDPREAAALMLRAQQLWGDGRHAAAVKLTADIIKRRPGFLPAVSQLIQWYQQDGQRKLALDMYKVAQKIYKDRQDVLARLAADLARSPQEKLKLQLQAAAHETDPLKRALYKAAVYRQHGMTEQFVKELKAAEAIKPDDPLVIELLFSHALGKSDWAGAQKYAERAAKADVDRVGGRMYRARLARAQKKYQEAIRLTLEALRLRPTFSQAHAFLGRCYLSVGRFDRAREEFRIAHEQNPSNVQALLGLVAVSEAEGRPAEYARWVQLAYKFRPEDPVVRERYLRLRESREKLNDVIRKREQWRRTEPGNVTNLARLGPLYERVGRWDDAESVYRDLQRLTKGSLLAIRLLTDLLRRTDRDAEARTLLAENARTNKDKVGAYLLWADYMERAEEYDQARGLYAKAVEADPKDPRGYIAAARFEARRRNWAKAADLQRRCLQQAANVDPRAELELIGYLIEAGQFDEVGRRIAALLAKNPEDKEVLTLQGLAFFRRGDFTKAKRTLDRVLSLAPGYARALVVRAQVHLANGDRTLAVADLEAARQAEVSPVVTRRLVEIYESMGDFANAHAVLQSLLVDRPGDAGALRALVELCARHGKWREMENALTEARKYYPRELYYIIQAVQMWRRTGRSAQAVAVLRKVKKVLPQSAEIGVLLAETLLDLGRVDEALKEAGALREHHDLGPSAMAICGRAFLMKKDRARAEKEFRAAVRQAKTGKRLSFVVDQLRAAYHPKVEEVTARLKAWVKLRPKDWQLPKLLADLLILQEDYEGAREQLARALERAEERVERFGILRQLAVVYYQLKDFENARKYYAKALEMTPDDEVALNNLAWMLAFDLEKVQEALPYAKRAVELAPYNAHALDTYGVVLTQLGKLEEALEVLNRSVDINPMPANRLHLGEAYEKAGRTSDALRQYRQGWRQVKGNSRDPYFRPLREALKRLGESTS